MSLGLPILPPDASRNAHLIFEAQKNPQRILVADTNDNLQRQGTIGWLGASVSNAWTMGVSAAQRTAEVHYIANKTLEKLNQHLATVKQIIDQKKPDFNNEAIRAEIRNAINICPPRPFLPKMKVREEPMYLIDPEKIHQVHEYSPTSNTAYPYRNAYKAMGKLSEPAEVLKARIVLAAIELSERIQDKMYAPNQKTNSDFNSILEDQLYLQMMTHKAKGVIEEYEYKQSHPSA